MFRVWLSTIYSLVLGLPVEEGLVEAYKVSVWGCLHREVHMLDGCACGSRSGMVVSLTNSSTIPIIKIDTI